VSNVEVSNTVVSSQTLIMDFNLSASLANATITVLTAGEITESDIAVILANTVTPSVLLSDFDAVQSNLVNPLSVVPTFSVTDGERIVLYDPNTASQIWYVS